MIMFTTKVTIIILSKDTYIMQHKTLGILEISNTLQKELFNSNLNLVQNSNFTHMPEWLLKGAKDELVLLFGRIKKIIDKIEFKIQYSESFSEIIKHGCTSESWNIDQINLKQKQVQTTKELFEKIDSLICTELKNNKLLNFTIKQKLARNICLPNLGKLKFNRTQFKVKTNKGYRTIILLDYFLNLRRRGILLKGIELDLVQSLIELKSTRKVALMQGCSPQTIVNACKNFSCYLQENIVSHENCEIFVAADSTYTHLHRKKGRKHEIKTLVLWTNSKSVTNSKLSDRILIHVPKQTISDTCEIVKSNVQKYFPNYTSIKVIGDGASWIKKLGHSFDGYYLDKFHYISSVITLVKLVIGKNKIHNKKLSEIAKAIVYKNVYSNEFQNIEDMILKIIIGYSKTNLTIGYNKILNNQTGEIFDLENKEVLENLLCLIQNNEKFKYIKNNWVYFSKTCKEDIINPIEAIQAHYVTSTIRINRSPNSAWLVKLKLLVKFTACNQFQLKVLINNPISGELSDNVLNSNNYKYSTWYNLDKVTNSFVSTNMHNAVYRTPKLSSIY